VAGGGDGEQIHEADVFAAFVGRAVKHLRKLVAGGGERREEVAGVLDGGMSLGPVDHKDGLHLRDDGAFDFEVGVAPVRRVLGVAGPGIADAHAAGEAHAAVDDEDFAVGAVVEMGEVIPAGRVVAQDDAAGGAQLVDEALVHAHGAGPVKEDEDAHAGAGAGGEGVGELLADVTRPVDVGFEGDGFQGAVDGGEHGREDGVAVEELGDGVAREQLGAEEDADGSGKLGVVDAVGGDDGMLHLALAALEVGGHHKEGHTDADTEKEEPHACAAAGTGARRGTAEETAKAGGGNGGSEVTPQLIANGIARRAEAGGDLTVSCAQAVSGCFSDWSQSRAGVPIRVHRARKVRTAALCVEGSEGAFVFVGSF
jgi:hypothetical protein